MNSESCMLTSSVVGPSRHKAMSAPMSAKSWIVLQKSPRRSCGIEIRKNRIGANEFLNRCCAFTLDLESILRARMRKIVLQHNRESKADVLVTFANDASDPKATWQPARMLHCTACSPSYRDTYTRLCQRFTRKAFQYKV